MVVGQPHRTRIDVETGIELAMLGEPAQFGDGVAAADGDVTTAGLVLIFQDLHLVAGAGKFQRRGQAGQARAQYQHGRAARIAFELDRAGVAGLARKTQIGHRLIHDRAARGRADHAEQ